MTESHPNFARGGRYRPMMFIGVVFIGMAAVVTVSKLWTPTELVPWRTDLAAAKEEARRLKKPMLVYLTAQWCGPCQSMRRNVWTDARIADALGGYVPVRIDIDRQPDLARTFGAAGSVPWFFLMDPQGEVVRSVNRAMETEQMLAWLKR